MFYERLAFDTNSQRTKDANGYLRVAVSHITKESVNPYYGRDIPGGYERGLLPYKRYYGYREGAALKKAVPSFNGLPLLLGHYHESAANPQKQHRVGSLGTEATFNAPYIDNSLIVTDAKAIEAIENGSARELSAAYRYDPIWQSGEFEGQHYDFIMRNIEGNHVALVKEGRAGHDVIVEDEMPEGMKDGVNMADNEATKKLGALDSLLNALGEAKEGAEDTDAILEKNFPDADEKSKGTVRKILEMVSEPKAEDEEEDNGVNPKAIMKQQGIVADEDSVKEFEAGREFARKKYGQDCGNKSPAEIEDEDEDEVIEDEDDEVSEGIDPTEDDDDEETPVNSTEDDDDEDLATEDDDDEDPDAITDDEEEHFNPAFKAGLKYEKMQQMKNRNFNNAAAEQRIAHDAQIKTIRKVRKLYRAADAVAPIIGRIKDPLAFDSAGDIYRKALRACGVSTKNVHPSAYPAMLKLAKRSRGSSVNSSPKRAVFAMDAKDNPEMTAIFDGLNSIRKG